VADNFFNILGSIVTLAVVAVVVSSSQLAGIIRAFGSAFAGAINAAQKV
jgi:hypothetical protein